MIEFSELRRKAREWKIPEQTIEKDYVLGWVLKGIFSDELLRESLVLKGGTALRKTYFPEYRFSEDLDFTGTKNLDLELLKERLNVFTSVITEQSGIEFETIKVEKTRDKLGEEAYDVRLYFIGPRRQRVDPPRIKLDISYYEELMLPSEKRILFHPYSDEKDCIAEVEVYTLGEILAEKMRALIQRTRPRDLYDVWFLLKFHSDSFKREKLTDLFLKKCAYKKVEYKSIKKFGFEDRKQDFINTWRTSLQNQLRSPPDGETVINEIKSLLDSLFLVQ